VGAYEIALTHMFWNGIDGCWLELFFTMYLYIPCDELIRYLLVFFMICIDTEPEWIDSNLKILWYVPIQSLNESILVTF
jgi:hypothetical protein